MTTKSKKMTGYLSATIVAFLQGFEGIFVSLFAFIFVVVEQEQPAFGAAVMGGKELFGLVLAFCVIGPKTFINMIKKLRSKQGLYFGIAAFIGTALGNLFYVLAVLMAGAGYGVILTALYPIFSMLLIKFFMKEKEPKLVWVGVVITVVAGFLFLLIPSLFDSKGQDFNWKIFGGMLLGALAALFWAFEGYYIKKGMMIKDKNAYTNNEIVATRNFFSTLSTWIIIMPVAMVWGNSFNFFGNMISNWQPLLILFALAFNIVLLRYLHVKAIDFIGPKLTAIIDTNTFLVPAILSEGLQFLPLGLNNEMVYEPIAWWSFFLLIPVAIGVFMVIYFHKYPDESIEEEKIKEH